MLQQNDGKSSFHYELPYFYSEQVSLCQEPATNVYFIEQPTQREIVGTTKNFKVANKHAKIYV